MNGSRIVGPGKVRVPKFGLDNGQRKQVGGLAIALIHKRVTQQHTGATGNAMPPYSPHGPIYIPITGAGRSKSSLKGREVFSVKDLKYASSRRLGIVYGSENLGRRGRSLPSTSRALDTPGRGAMAAGSVTHSGKSMRFANRADYKRFLGKSGQRDLELSGRMLGAMTIVANTPAYIDLGFTREQEAKKAEGNQERSPWFALAPNTDVQPVSKLIETFLIQNVVKQL